MVRWYRDPCKLTPAETKVLALYNEGKKLREIAKELGIGYANAQKLLYNALHKAQHT